MTVACVAEFPIYRSRAGRSFMVSFFVYSRSGKQLREDLWKNLVSRGVPMPMWPYCWRLYVSFIVYLHHIHSMQGDRWSFFISISSLRTCHYFFSYSLLPLACLVGDPTHLDIYFLLSWLSYLQVHCCHHILKYSNPIPNIKDVCVCVAVINKGTSCTNTQFLWGHQISLNLFASKLKGGFSISLPESIHLINCIGSPK